MGMEKGLLFKQRYFRDNKKLFYSVNPLLASEI